MPVHPVERKLAAIFAVGGRVRITGQLMDAETGTHLWADRFHGSLDDPPPRGNA